MASFPHNNVLKFVKTRKQNRALFCSLLNRFYKCLKLHTAYTAHIQIYIIIGLNFAVLLATKNLIVGELVLGNMSMGKFVHLMVLSLC